MKATNVVSGFTVRCLSRNTDLGYAENLASAAMDVTEHSGGIGWVRADLVQISACYNIRAWFTERIRDNLTSVFVAEDVHARVLGSVLLVRNDPFHAAAARHRAEVKKLLVHPKCRRQGIAGALMNALIATARKEKLQQLTLDVRHSPEQAAAHALYKSLGFIEFGWQSNYALAEGVRYDGVYMALDLF